MTHLDNKKYLESILQGGDDDDDLGKMDYNLGDIDVNTILNEVDDFDLLPENSPPFSMEKKNNEVLGPPPVIQANISKPEIKKFEEIKQEEIKSTPQPKVKLKTIFNLSLIRKIIHRHLKSRKKLPEKLKIIMMNLPILCW